MEKFLSISKSQFVEGKKVSDDGHFCIECSMTESETQCSSCPFRYFTQRTISANGTLMVENCAKCPANTKVSARGDTCIPCIKTDDSCECQVPFPSKTIKFDRKIS